jgi:hypothetical protein
VGDFGYYKLVNDQRPRIYFIQLEAHGILHVPGEPPTSSSCMKLHPLKSQRHALGRDVHLAAYPLPVAPSPRALSQDGAHSRNRLAP